MLSPCPERISSKTFGQVYDLEFDLFKRFFVIVTIGKLAGLVKRGYTQKRFIQLEGVINFKRVPLRRSLTSR